MGNTVCTISGLPMEIGTRLRVVFLAHVGGETAHKNAPVYNPSSWYVPVSGMAKAHFDDFAKIDGIEDSVTMDLFRDKYFAGQSLQALADAAVKQELTMPSPSHTMHKNGQESELCVAYINEDVYQSLLNITHEGKLRNFNKETAQRFEVLKDFVAANKTRIQTMQEMGVMNLRLLATATGENYDDNPDLKALNALFHMSGDATANAQKPYKDEVINALLDGNVKKAEALFTDLTALNDIQTMMHVLNRSWQPAMAISSETFSQAHVVFNEAVSKIAKGRRNPPAARNTPKM